MCKVQMLRALVKQRLTAAAEEIFGLFERTIAEYEEQLCRSKEENERQRKLLDAVYNPQLRLHRAEVQQQLLVVKEEVPPEQQEWSSSVDQEDPEPPHIKEEEEELWSSQEGEQLQGLEEADITKFTFTPVPVKSEDDEETPQSEGHHCGGPGPGPPGAGPPGAGPAPGDSPEPDPDTDDSREWEEPGEPPSGSVPLSTPRQGEKPFGCTNCEKRFGFKNSLKRHMRTHTGEKPFGCSLCDAKFLRMENLKRHTIVHTGEKPYRCSVCGKTFNESGHLNRHMRNHTGEKPFSCSVCGKRFPRKDNYVQHMTCHTGEKPFSCSVCGRSFSWRTQLKNHQCSGGLSSRLHQTRPEENKEGSDDRVNEQDSSPVHLFPHAAL